MHVCIWVLMYISDAWIIYMAYSHFACVYSLNLVYSIHNIDYIYIYIHSGPKKNLGCHCHSILSRHQRRSALARCFHGIYSPRGSCRRTWTTAVWSSSALQWGNLQWSPFGLLGKMLGEYLLNIGDPESKDPKRCGKWGKPIGKWSTNGWFFTSIFSYRRKNMEKHDETSDVKLTFIIIILFDSNMINR